MRNQGSIMADQWDNAESIADNLARLVDQLERDAERGQYAPERPHLGALAMPDGGLADWVCRRAADDGCAVWRWKAANPDWLIEFQRTN